MIPFQVDVRSAEILDTPWVFHARCSEELRGESGKIMHRILPRYVSTCVTHERFLLSMILTRFMLETGKFNSRNIDKS